MNSITLTPPWGSLIAAAAIRSDLGKHVETRSWPLPAAYVGVELAIHQAATLPRGVSEQELGEMCGSERPFHYALTALGYTDWKDLPRGKIVAVVVPVGSYPTAQVYARDCDDDPLSLRTGYIHGDRFTEISETERAFGNYGPRRFAWPLAQIRALRSPLPYRGGQRLRRLPEDVAAQVRAQLS